MPEFVSVDELEILVQHYQDQIKDLTDQMWFVGNGNSCFEPDNIEYRELLEKKKPLLKRKYYIQRCIKNRSKNAKKSVQPLSDSPGIRRTGTN
jgi:hypothetical protein